jgi:WD40 repeat protein
VAISPDNRWLVTGSADMTARLWDLSAKDSAANSPKTTFRVSAAL